MKTKTLLMIVALAAFGFANVQAQVNSGSDGSDGALDFSAITVTTNIIIDMHDHSNGIYQYTYVSIPNGVTLSFIPNANNTPVYWLVQSNCTIDGTVSVRGNDSTGSVSGSSGGPGGSRGGNGILAQGLLPGAGFGLGGGQVGDTNWCGGNGSYGTVGACNTNAQSSSSSGTYAQYLPGQTYGNDFELPLFGGSGGSGSGVSPQGGGGGGGAILIAANGTLNLSGSILAGGGNGYYTYRDNNGNYWQAGNGGAGSGGAIRLIASTLTGNGPLDTAGGSCQFGWWCGPYACGSYDNNAGNGRIRLEGLSDTFTGSTVGVTTHGYTGIIFLATNTLPQLSIVSVGGVPVSSSPTGQVATPDAILDAQQNDPISIVVNCVNLPMNTPITVCIRPSNGPSVSALGYNSIGTPGSSTATISVAIPRGGGFLYATIAISN